MVGVTSKGPTQTRTYISNQQQFIDTFGEPDDTIGFESYAALQYLRRGRQLWFVRVVGAAAAEAEATFYTETDVTAGHPAPTPAFDSLEDEFTFAALSLGDNGIVPGSVILTITKADDTTEVFTDDGEGVLDGAVDGVGTIDYVTGVMTIDCGAKVPKTGSQASVNYSYYVDAFVATALSEGEWGNNISILVEDGTNAGTFKLSVYYDGVRQERYDNLVLDDTSDYYIETKLNDVSDYVTIAVDGGMTGTEEPSFLTTATSLAGGDSDASNVAAADIVGEAWDNVLLQPTGLQLFASAWSTDINLLVAPGWYDAAVSQALIEICETRADCMAILDPPEDLNAQEVVDWHNGEGTFNDHAAYNSSYAATYYPWIKVYDAYNAQYVFTPPSGHVLAVYAYTDYNAETWFAPAGLQRGRVISGTDTAYDITPGEMDLLYGDGNAVNPIVNFPQLGIVVWGQRTLQRSPTALDRVNVRRLLLYLRKTISTAASYLVFEPNDEKTWKLFGHLVIPYLNDVRQRRGLYDFRVKCDETTNTPTVIDRNELHAQILLKPVKAAEFIQIDFVLTSTGANFDEVLY
jgi:hypothetical protein